LGEREVIQIMETNLLSFLVVSLAQPSLEALGRNLLEQFMRCLEWCHVKERNQLNLLLYSIALTPNVTRLQCMFVVHAIHVMMQPSHPLFQPLTDYLLITPALPSLPFFEEALMMKYLPSLLKHDDMQGGILFVLNYIEHGFMETDQHARSSLEKVKVHLKGLLIEHSTKGWRADVERQAKVLLDRL
jgi:nucleolar pre-ribosomal-associated protein 1